MQVDASGDSDAPDQQETVGDSDAPDQKRMPETKKNRSLAT